jgi:hypothetical protein
MYPAAGPADRLFRACIVLSVACSVCFAEDVSIASYNIRHFQGYSPGLESNWSRWADTEWYPNPSKPGFYDYFAGLLGSLDADVIALQGSSVPEHDLAGDPAGGRGEMAIVPELARRLGMHYYVQERSRFHGFAFLSRFPIVGSADFTLRGSPGTGLVRVTLQLADGRNLHVYSTYLDYADPEVRKQELAFNARTIEEEDLHPHVYLGDFRVDGVDSGELDVVRGAGYEGRGHVQQAVWVKAGGEIQVLGVAPVENERTSQALSSGETVGAQELPFKAVLRVRGPYALPEARRGGMLEALNLTEDELRAAETAVSASTKPIHEPDVLRRMVVPEDRFRRMSLVPVARPEFQLALRIETKEQPQNPWDVSTGAKTVRPIAEGDALVASFWARSLPGQGPGGPGRMTFRFQEARPPWRGPTVEFRDLGPEWRPYRVVFASPGNYLPGEAEFRFHCGHAPQIIELAEVEIVNCRNDVPLSNLVAFSRYEQLAQACEQGGPAS